MRILVIGSGGREHALTWKIAQSPLVEKIYCAPGNAGMSEIAECVPIKADNLGELTDFAARKQIDLTVVGPEAPLIAGIVDHFEAAGLPIFGPSREPAQVEGSKIFSKKLMETAGIPTAKFWTCDTLTEARECVRAYYLQMGAAAKIVIKADGLAAGKGVIVAENEAEANGALDRFMGKRVFGASGDHVVIEECLIGEEVSLMVITDGTNIVPLLPSQDHKRVFDGDLGPNTGGMGAYAPVPILHADTASLAIEQIVRPAIQAIREFGIPYRGVLYAGIMVTEGGPKCIEFNCRLGDPETQAILPLLESDLVPVLLGVIEGTLDQVAVRWRSGSSVCVVASSEGYPDAFDPGREVSPFLNRPISGLTAAASLENCLVFHAGTKLEGDQVVSSGGRVLSVTGLGDDLLSATANAYLGIDKIHFDGIHYRRDIATHSLHNTA